MTSLTEVMNLLVSPAEGARFENPTVTETISLDLVQSFQSQLLTEEFEAGEEPVKPDRTR